MNKLIFTLALIISASALILPSVIACNLYNETMEYKAEVILLQQELEKTNKEIRLLQQDIVIINNIVFEKDFIKR